MAFGSAASAVLLLVLKIRHDMPRKVKWVPAPLGIGSTVPLVLSTLNWTLYDLIESWRQRLGMTFAWTEVAQYVVCTCDPANIEHITKTNFENYVKGEAFRMPFSQFLGQGIFSADGAVWHSQRKTMSRMFTKKLFEGHIFQCTERNTEKVIKILDATEGVIDIFELISRFTLDLTTEIGFGSSLRSLEDPDTPFQRAIDRGQQLILRRQFVPAWRLLRALNIGYEAELREHLKVWDAGVKKILRDAKAHLVAGETTHSFLALFLADPTAAETAVRELGISQDQFLEDMVRSFIIAGRDTAAQCLAYTIFELALHPAVVEKVRAEIQQVCGTEPIAFSKLNQLRYVQAVLDEALRLHPSVPFDKKISVEKDVWPDGTILPANSVILYSMWNQGRSPEIWGQDATKFRPERWLELPTKPSSFTFTAFNAGPRECLGRKLAEMEMTLFLASIIRDFDISLTVEPKEVKYGMGLTLGMNALPVRVQRRPR